MTIVYYKTDEIKCVVDGWVLLKGCSGAAQVVHVA